MKIRPQFRWKAMTLVVAVLVVGSVTAWFFGGRPSRRQEFVCLFGVEDGYQCRFTLGAGWRVESVHTDEQVYEIYRPFNPIQRWLQEQLLGRYTDDDIEFSPAPVLSPRDVSLQNGYPVTSGIPLSTRHLIIDGCPASVATFPSSKTPSTLATHLFLYSPNQKMFYVVSAYSYRKGDQIVREMQAIIASFHVDKFGSASAGKR